LRPDLLDARFALAMALKGLGRLDEAAEAYRQVIAQQPGHRAAMTWLARILLRRGRHEEGLAWLTRAGGMIAFSARRGVPFALLGPEVGARPTP
ncbi:MAG: tetratricopeptide repeat protein, partial [Kiloniellales bacterium]|nr:tetratricopeptide repeat protein [Kiloniellales bacterium]